MESLSPTFTLQMQNPVSDQNRTMHLIKEKENCDYILNISKNKLVINLQHKQQLAMLCPN